MIIVRHQAVTILKLSKHNFHSCYFILYETVDHNMDTEGKKCTCTGVKFILDNVDKNFKASFQRMDQPKKCLHYCHFCVTFKN